MPGRASGRADAPNFLTTDTRLASWSRAYLPAGGRLAAWSRLPARCPPDPRPPDRPTRAYLPSRAPTGPQCRPAWPIGTGFSA